MLLRSALIAAASLVAIVTAAAASETARAPGAYASLTMSNSAACARACAEDGICMAWSFHHDNQCQLSAVVPTESVGALASGFSSRAPAALRPPIVYTESAPAPLAPQLAQQTPADEAPASIEAEDDGLVLLGGPDEGGLRLGLR
jgi:hypothetical protein